MSLEESGPILAADMFMACCLIFFLCHCVYREQASDGNRGRQLCPAEFSTSPYQTHMSVILKRFWLDYSDV